MKMSSGFTIVELMIVIVVTAIGIALAVPSFQDMIERKAVGGAAEAAYEQLQLARSQALKRSKPILVDFYVNGTSWAIGLTDLMTGCNAETTGLFASGACVISDYNNDTNTADRQLKRIIGADYKNITMSQVAPGFSNDVITSGGCFTGTNTADQACFDFVHGLAKKGAYDFSSANYKLRVAVSNLGNVKICVPPGEKKIPGYNDC